MKATEQREFKVCRRHDQYFPDEVPERPISEFASNGKHSYCRRCMKFISKGYQAQRAAAGGSVPKARQKEIVAGAKPLPPRTAPSTRTTSERLSPEEARASIRASLKGSSLGVDPAIDTPFVAEGKDGLWAFKNYWFAGDVVTVIGCEWAGRGTWRTDLHLFGLKSVRPPTAAELKAAGVLQEAMA